MCDEAKLIEKAKAGDAGAFESALIPHLTALFLYSRALCGDYHTAQDVVQETALIAYRNLDRYFADADFAGWLKAIARRQALAARRKLGRQRLLAEAALESAFEIEPSDRESLRQAALRDCFEQLPDPSRELLKARYAEGLNLTETAAAFNTTVDSLRSRLYRVRQGLRECVERRIAQEEKPWCH